MGQLRAHLQAVTAESHRATEALFERFDVRTASGLADFLCAHAGALSGVSSAASRAGDDRVQAIVSPLLDAIARDLQLLTAAGKIPEIGFPDEKWNTAGVTYVIAGSRLGATVLSRKLASARETQVRKAQNYLSAPEGDGLWNNFRLFDETSSFERTELDDASRAALAVFDCFAQAAVRVSRTG